MTDFTDHQLRRYAKALHVKGELRLARARYSKAEAYEIAQGCEDALNRYTRVYSMDRFHVVHFTSDQGVLFDDGLLRC